MFYLNNKLFFLSIFSNYFIGYLNCLKICNTEIFNILNVNYIFNYFIYNFKYYFITIDIKRDFFFKNIIIRPLNNLFIFFYKKKINFFYIKIFNINYNKYYFDHNLCNFFFFKKKINYYYIFFFYIYKFILLNNNLIFNIQIIHNYLNILINFFFLFLINF